MSSIGTTKSTGAQVDEALETASKSLSEAKDRVVKAADVLVNGEPELTSGEKLAVAVNEFSKDMHDKVETFLADDGTKK